ncbi:MAG: AAA family ATPase [Deltaproteobacteria bacterium]|nr:AAA family ATPase [Deltaproteobacteria bacterium]MBW2088396.1 AAA family ATPase [Deltaproteobacteria bacterium]MBW2320706.1 AAA family ATPase [Deltaproteobacteria bacterium]
MYKNFFSFRERPFKLVPNPAYLFLSKSHEEVLAHLTYAVIQGDGFVEITGEVGTGKTTICRAFLENLDHNTKAAYIFNPSLNAIQLLKAIIDEFGIESDTDNIKDLIDRLNSFLIAKKSEGKNVILIIDEAQNLTKEVLEQLRLLSNLETAEDKLIQIILVGQPELGEKLDSHELRQLDQRITLRCQLAPLSYKEVRAYIQHRINIASLKTEIQFDAAAYRSIYQYSRGIPRLINIVCDRALLNAFVLNQEIISGKIAMAAIHELGVRGDMKRRRLQKWKKTGLFFALLCTGIIMVLVFRSELLNDHAKLSSLERNGGDTSRSNRLSRSKHLKTSPSPKPLPDSKSVKAPVKIPDKALAKAPALKESKIVRESVSDLVVLLKKLNRFYSRNAALKVAMDLWGTQSEIGRYLNGISDDQAFFHLASDQNGLLIRRIEGSFNAVQKLNLPAILEFHLPGDPPPVYLTLNRIDEEKITLRGGKKDISIELEPNDLKSYWSGVAYIPWKNFLSLAGTIPLDSPKVSIITLKLLLRDIGFNSVEINPFYDENTRQAVKNVQKKYGIHVDGVVGSTTKIALYNEKKFKGIPHISKFSNIR